MVKILLEYIIAIAISILIAVFIRSFFFEPFRIPSGSMLPNLQIGDYVIANKMKYGYSKYSFPFGRYLPFSGRFFASPPERGEVIVFKKPHHTEEYYVKRLIGLPGDKVQYVAGRLVINGKVVPRHKVKNVEVGQGDGYKMESEEYFENLPGGVSHRIYEFSDSEVKDNTEVFEVPQGHYFMLGDNRDNSEDSRYWGFVKAENLVAKVSFAAVSFDSSFRLYNPISYFTSIRYDRIFKVID